MRQAGSVKKARLSVYDALGGAEGIRTPDPLLAKQLDGFAMRLVVQRYAKTMQLGGQFFPWASRDYHLGERHERTESGQEHFPSGRPNRWCKLSSARWLAMHTCLQAAQVCKLADCAPLGPFGPSAL